ncbi:MAG: dihydroneopterin aldolase [Acidimicrobiales bacterium]
MEGPSGDRIELRGLRVTGVHGVLDEERQRRQPFEVDLDVWADLSAASASDRLEDTVDYGAVAAATESVVASRSFRLLEALAGEVARVVLASDDRVLGVAVTVRKLRPPLPLDVATTAVRLVRRRAPR